MRRSVMLGWILGIITFGAGLLIGANWYDVRMLPNGATTENLRQFVQEGCEPIQSPSLLYFRCPHWRLH